MRMRSTRRIRNALAAQSLLPDIQLASDRFSRLAGDEASSGALTGTSGSGTVVQLLTQMANDLRGLGAEIAGSRETVKALYDEGGEHISRMRALVSASGAVQQRADAFGEEAVALAGVIASLQQTSVAPAVRRAADDLASSFIAPVADGDSEDLRTRQELVVGSVEGAVAAQSKALATAADQILAAEPVRPERFVPLSRPDAVLRYASDFLPSWAGAISIDLLPAVLVLILVAVHGAIRREENPEVVDNVMTAADMIQAMRLYERMRREELATERLAEPAQPRAGRGAGAALAGRSRGRAQRAPQRDAARAAARTRRAGVTWRIAHRPDRMAEGPSRRHAPPARLSRVDRPLGDDDLHRPARADEQPGRRSLRHAGAFAGDDGAAGARQPDPALSAADAPDGAGRGQPAAFRPAARGERGRARSASASARTAPPLRKAPSRRARRKPSRRSWTASGQRA